MSRNLTELFIWQRYKLETQNIYTRPQAHHRALQQIIWSPVVHISVACALVNVSLFKEKYGNTNVVKGINSIYVCVYTLRSAWHIVNGQVFVFISICYYHQ